MVPFERGRDLRGGWWDPGSRRLADNRPVPDWRVRWRYRWPPVDPRRSRASGGGTLPRDHRARVPHAVA